MNQTSVHSLSFVLLFLVTAVRPAWAQISINGRLVHDFNLRPGETQSGTLLIQNETTDIQQARIYQTDYFFFADGTNLYEEPGSVSRSNADCIQFSPPVLTIPPGEILPVTFAVSVPDSNDLGSLSGTYWSMLMVEGILAGSAESTLPAENQQTNVGFNQVTRYGVQIATHIKDTGSRLVSFDNVQMIVDEDGNKFFQIDIVNEGESAIHPEMYVQIFGTDGLDHGKYEGTGYRMYPGTSIRQRIDLSSLDAARYQVLVVIDAGDEDVFGAQYELDF